MVNVNALAGDEVVVPADWRFILLHNYNVHSMLPGAGSLILESWVEAWTDDDAHLI